MRELAILYVLVVVQTVVFVAASVAFARMAGARVTTIAIGTPAVVRLRKAAPVVQVGPLPSGYIELHGRADEQDDGDPRSWKRLGRAGRVLVMLGPWLVIFAGAVVCLGPTHALRSFAHAFDQVLFTVDVTPLVRRFLDLVATAPLATAAGIMLAKLTAANLLPFGGMAGGNAILELLPARARRGFQGYLMVTLLLVMFWFLGRFGWALIRLV